MTIFDPSGLPSTVQCTIQIHCVRGDMVTVREVGQDIIPNSKISNGPKFHNGESVTWHTNSDRLGIYDARAFVDQIKRLQGIEDEKHLIIDAEVEETGAEIEFYPSVGLRMELEEPMRGGRLKDILLPKFGITTITPAYDHHGPDMTRTFSVGSDRMRDSLNKVVKETRLVEEEVELRRALLVCNAV